MEYTDKQMMLLEQITYLNDDVYKNIKNVQESKDNGKSSELKNENLSDTRKMTSVEQLVKSFTDEDIETLEAIGNNPILNEEGNSTYMSGAEWAAVIKAIKADDSLMKLQISNTTSVKMRYGGYNINAMTFYEKGDSNNAIVCFRGTLNGEEWEDNAEYLELASTDRNQSALLYVDSLPFKNVSVVGHSKGGNKAAYTYYNSDKVKYCLAMDAPGFPPEFYKENAAIISSKKGKIQSYVLESDFVNILMLPIPGAEYHYCKGYGLDGFFENHSPNSYFKVLYDSENRVSGLSGMTEVDTNTGAMKLLHDFTAFVAIEMPYGERIKVADYLGDFLKMALGDKKYTKKDLVKKLLAEPRTLAKICAYWKKYCDVYDIGTPEITNLISSIAFNNEPIKAGVSTVGIGYAIGETSARHPVLVSSLIPVLLLVFFAQNDNAELKDLIDYLNEKWKSGELKDLEQFINDELAELGGIKKRESLDYSSYSFRKYNYTKAAYDAILLAIKEFENIEYDNTTIWTNYSEEEWFEDISGTEVQVSLNTFINQVSKVNKKCKKEFKDVFNKQWQIDDNYYNKMTDFMGRMNSCINKLQNLRDRMEFNVSDQLFL